MTESATAAALVPPIDTDLSCAICGYNLKGLSPDANCPECGQPIARTFTAELSHSDPAWLRHQSRTMLLLIGLCLANYTARLRGSLGTMAFVVSYFPLVAAMVAAWGCWRLATPDPAALPDYGRGMLQRSLRLAALLVAVLSVAVPLQGYMRPAFTLTATTAGFVCLIATNILVGLFLLDLARRTRDARLILHARIVLWTFPFIQIIALFGQFGLAFVFTWADQFGQWVIEVLNVLHFALAAAAYAAAFLFGRMLEVLRAAANTADARTAPAPSAA